MNHFDYRNGVLHAEAVDLVALADAVGTPFYCYSTATWSVTTGVCRRLRGREIAGLLLAESQLQPVGAQNAGKARAGADVVSGGELKRARAAGIPPDKILFSGVGKTRPNCARRWLRTCSASMLSRARTRVAVALAVEMGARRGCRSASIRTWIPARMRNRHRQIGNKFAFRHHARAVYARAANCRASRSTASIVHIGSQITTLLHSKPRSAS